MSKNLPKTLGKVLLVSLLLLGILLQTTQTTAQSNLESTPDATVSPTSIPDQYTIYLPVLTAGPQLNTSSVWTADANGTPKSAFVPGETVRFYSTGYNISGDSALAGFSWYQEGPCGSSTLSIETVNVSEEGWTRYKTSLIPDCPGIYTFTLMITYDGQVSSSSASYVVNYPSVVISSTRQAFDRCNIPTTTQMQKWWTDSPYFGVNLYIGGISRGCANFGLNEFYVHILSQQGWELIPTWVGPQAPCSTFKYRMSSDAATAYLQGRSEASSAAATAASLGFSKDRVVYYDLEGYAKYATLACRGTVQSFLKGWTERLHELGVLSGVYGAAYSSYMNDWINISPPPDQVWIASWYRSYYDPDATVWGVNYLDDSLWSNHQRIRQYAGDHVESWGGESFTIDSNITDGAVAIIPVTLSSAQIMESQELSKQHSQLRDMGQVSIESGWALQGQQLFWSDDGGATWKDITPALGGSENLINAHFLDNSQGLLVVQNRATGEVFILRTENRGENWQAASLTEGLEGYNPQINSAYVHFIDSQTGWVALKHESSSNFSLGSLFGTKDGGTSWSELTLPVAGPVYFKDPLQGWVAGGASGAELYFTVDGGQTWVDQGVSIRPEIENGELFFGLPSFIDSQTGYLPLTVADPVSPRVEVYESQDGGSSWSHSTSVLLDPESLPGGPLPLSFLEQEQRFLAPGGQGRFLSFEPGTSGILELADTTLPGNILNTDFVQPSSGWVQVLSGECDGDKQKPGETVPQDQEGFTCELRSLLYKTSDGGKTWIEITP